MSRIKVVVAFDFGLRHIGLAVGQGLTRTASDLDEVRANQGKPSDWAAVDTVITTWQPDRLLVGLPLNMDGTESEMSAHARRFARRLEGRYHLPTTMVDERLTSVEARELAESGESQHGLAARLIAESWLGEN